MRKIDIEKITSFVLLLSKLKRYHSNYRVFQQTNEDLYELSKIIDVAGKDVMTVLSSSDQAFYFYYAHAKNIDTFDKSIITLFYYYLRKWLIIYKNQLYPSCQFFYDNDKDLYDLICSINPICQDEYYAQMFWKIYLEQNQYKADRYLFHYASFKILKPFEHDLNGIKGIFNQPLSFTCMNMFRPISISKQYQILFLSNLMEYSKTDEDLIQARNNIEKMLVTGGIAVCTHLVYQSKDVEHLNEVRCLTSGNLEKIDDDFPYFDRLNGNYRDFAYLYKKNK